MNPTCIFAVLMSGITMIFVQSLFIRELLVIFQGNELTIGIVLFGWLIASSAGTFLLNRQHPAKPGSDTNRNFLLLSFVLNAASLPFLLIAIRCLRSWLGLLPGETMGLFSVCGAGISMILVPAVISGAQFTLALRTSASADAKKPAPGTVYFYESAGTVAGALVFAFWAVKADPSRMVFLLCFLNLAAASVLACTCLKKYFLVCAAFAAGILMVSHFPEKVGRWSLEKQWQPYRVIESKNSFYGNIAVIGSAEQLTFFFNGAPVASAPVPDIARIEELVHVPVLFHHGPGKILLIGEGTGGIISELLKYPVEIDYAELDPELIRVMRRKSTPLTEAELSDKRVTVRFIDGRRWMKKGAGSYDIIFVSLPAPSTLQVNRLFTAEFFLEAGKLLNPSGILVITTPGSETYMNDEQSMLNACLYRTMTAEFNCVRVIPGTTNILIASMDASILRQNASEISRKFLKNRIPTRFLGKTQLHYLLDEEKNAGYMKAIQACSRVNINRDLHPSGLFYALGCWIAEQTPCLKKTWKSLGKITAYHILIVLVLLISIRFLMIKNNGKQTGTLLAAVGSTGFAGMAVNIIVILAFQAVYGQVYQMMSLLLACFMAGLCVGNWRMTATGKFAGAKTVRNIEFAWFAGLLVLSGYFLFGNNFSIPAGIIFFIANILAGFLAGSEFLPALTALKKNRPAASSAGMTYSADLAGAAAGALITGIMIACIGIPSVLFLLALIKLSVFFFLKKQGQELC